MLSQMMVSESLSAFSTSGGSASSGRRSATPLIASRTSLAAASMSRLRVNSMSTEARPLRLRDWMISTPSMPDSASSSTWVMRVSTTAARSEEHTSELQSLMRISYAVFCLKKKTRTQNEITDKQHELAQEHYELRRK